MMNRVLRVTTQVCLSMGTVVLLWAGLLSARERGWLAMGFFFYAFVVAVDFHIGFLLNLKIDQYVERLGGVVSANSGRIRLGKPLKPDALSIFTTISSVAMFSLAMFAAFKEHWLMLGVLWAAAGAIHVVSMKVSTARRIQAHCKRLQELISDKGDIGALE